MGSTAGLIFSVAAGIIVVLVVAWIPGAVADNRGHVNRLAIKVCGWCSILFPPLWFVALIWAFTGPSGQSLPCARRAYLPKRLPDEVEQWSQSKDGPGRYRVNGVEIQTGQEVSRIVQATDREAAHRIGEESGMAVTSVEWIGTA